MSRTVALRDAKTRQLRGHLELSTGTIRDENGKVIEQLMPCADNSAALEYRDAALGDFAARVCHANMAHQYGHPVTMTDSDGEGQLIKMDLSQSDVHTDAAMPNFAGGYKLAANVADIAMPVVTVNKASNKFNIWDSDNAFKRVIPTGGSAGGRISEINPTLSKSNYQTQEYCLGGYVPREVEANQDTPLNVMQAVVRRVMNALRLEREIRVATLLRTSGSFDSSLVKTIAAGAKWNGGASSDPIADLKSIILASRLDVTDIVMSELVEDAFQRNSNVQKFIFAKSGVQAIPTLAAAAPILGLPPITVAKMKYQVSSSSFTYVWGGDVVLLHKPPTNPPTDQEDIATAYTFRWNGGDAPDGTLTAGWLVRTFYDPKRGGRGGTMVVVVHNDAEVMTSSLVGGLLINAYQ